MNKGCPAWARYYTGYLRELGVAADETSLPLRVGDAESSQARDLNAALGKEHLALVVAGQSAIVKSDQIAAQMNVLQTIREGGYGVSQDIEVTTGLG